VAFSAGGSGARMTKLYFLYILFCVYKTRTLVCSMEYSGFFLTEELLNEWRQATNMKTESVTQSPTKSGYVNSNDFFNSTLSELTKPIHDLHESLLTKTMTIEELNAKIEESSIKWDLIQQVHKFYNKKSLEDVSLQSLMDEWKKIGKLLDLRTKAISVFDKIQEMQTTKGYVIKLEEKVAKLNQELAKLNQEIAKLNSELQEKNQNWETLRNSADEMGVKHRMYTKEYTDRGIATIFLKGHMHALLSALSTHSN
jgi:chromosome segregation ATPase